MSLTPQSVFDEYEARLTASREQAGQLAADLIEARRERDEARAEIERLRTIITELGAAEAAEPPDSPWEPIGPGFWTAPVGGAEPIFKAGEFDAATDRLRAALEERTHGYPCDAYRIGRIESCEQCYRVGREIDGRPA